MNSADASYDHGASYGTNHEMIVYDDKDRDTMRSKIKASEKTLVKAYISYSIYDSISNVVQEITRYNVPDPVPVLPKQDVETYSTKYSRSIVCRYGCMQKSC